MKTCDTGMSYAIAAVDLAAPPQWDSSIGQLQQTLSSLAEHGLDTNQSPRLLRPGCGWTTAHELALQGEHQSFSV